MRGSGAAGLAGQPARGAVTPCGSPPPAIGCPGRAAYTGRDGPQRILAHVRRTHLAPGNREAAQSDARRIPHFLRQQGASRVIGIGSAFVPTRRFTDMSLEIPGERPAAIDPALAENSQTTSDSDTCSATCTARCSKRSACARSKRDCRASWLRSSRRSGHSLPGWSASPRANRTPIATHLVGVRFSSHLECSRSTLPGSPGCWPDRWISDSETLHPRPDGTIRISVRRHLDCP